MNPALRVPAEFVAPSVEDTHLPPLFEVGSFDFGKQPLLILLSVVIIAAFFLLAVRRRALVPSKGQYLGEMGYGLVRNHLGRDIIGDKDFRPYVPLLFTFFFFILVNNLFGSIPILQLPTFSHPGTAYVFAIVAYVVWVVMGIKRHGFGRFMAKMTMPPDVPWVLYIILIPLEFLSNFIIRPVTHALRVFATMFAGHMAIMVAAAFTSYLAVELGGAVGVGTSILGVGLGIFIYFLEVLIQILQAYIFTLLFAVYVQGALQEGH